MSNLGSALGLARRTQVIITPAIPSFTHNLMIFFLFIFAIIGPPI